MLGAEDLLQRILTERQPPVFIVGAGLSLPLVPGTAEIERLIAHEYGQRIGSARAFLADLPAHGNRYQMAFERLLVHAGADSANAVIRRAVLNACEADDRTLRVIARVPATSSADGCNDRLFSSCHSAARGIGRAAHADAA